ncbi:MAG TPA: aspartate--tRNA(Asn) ligase [archaeon]|nr:aspartate--tRNA(Asn) ligase [archaeon]
MPIEKLYTKDVKPELDGKEVAVAGWLRNFRDSGKIKFLQLADITGTVQIIVKEGAVSEKVFKSTKGLNREDVLSVKGKVVKNETAPGKREIIPSEITVINKSESQLPLEIIAKKTPAELPTRLDNRPLDLRKPEVQAIFKIESAFLKGLQDYLAKNNYMQIFTPCLMGGASEGGSEVFRVPYFNTVAFLRQDPQLHRQLALLGGLDKIFDLGPNWRAEVSHTSFHLCEHRGCAVELSFIEDEKDVMRAQEELVRSALQTVAKECKTELEVLGKEITVPKTPFPELKFPELYDTLKELGFKIKKNEDLNREMEEALGKYVMEKHKSEFFFVNRFPFAIKPFYVMRVDETPEYARSVDMVFKGIEMSSGGQREHRYDKLMQNLKEKKMNANDVEWFTKFFRYGAPTHGGFCIGIERFIMKLLDLQNVREAVLFPRDPERLLP